MHTVLHSDSPLFTALVCESGDSFWTTWLHVKLWPDIDLAILQETAKNQCGAPTAHSPSACTAGKIPT